MAGLGIFVGVFAIAWLVPLARSLWVILITDEATWKASGMNRFMWLAVVLLMPVIGVLLFLFGGENRLRSAASEAIATR